MILQDVFDKLNPLPLQDFVCLVGLRLEYFMCFIEVKFEFGGVKELVGFHFSEK